MLHIFRCDRPVHHFRITHRTLCENIHCLLASVIGGEDHEWKRLLRHVLSLNTFIRRDEQL